MKNGRQVVVDRLTLQSKIRTIFRSVRLNLPNSSVKQDLDALRSHNGNLQRLFSNCPSHPAEKKTAVTAINPETFTQISEHANDLHEAICKGYSCECPKPHKANLGTRQVLPKYMDLKRPFDILFTLEEEEYDTQKRISDLDLTCSTSPSDRTMTTEVYGSEFSTR